MKRTNNSIQLHKKKYLDILLFFCVCGTLANIANIVENIKGHIGLELACNRGQCGSRLGVFSNANEPPLQASSSPIPGNSIYN